MHLNVNETQGIAPDQDCALDGDEQLQQLAGQIAGGEVLWPTDLPQEHLLPLVEQVCRHRRERLVRWIAGTIARSLRSS